MNILNIKIVSPARTLVNTEASSITVPTELGFITVLPNHEPLVANLVPGEAHLMTNQGEMFMHVAGGFIQVEQGNRVDILADAAEHATEINLERAEAAERRARESLASKLDAEEYAVVTAALERSLARIRIARKHAHRRAPITGKAVFEE